MIYPLYFLYISHRLTRCYVCKTIISIHIDDSENPTRHIIIHILDITTPNVFFLTRVLSHGKELWIIDYPSVIYAIRAIKKRINTLTKNTVFRKPLVTSIETNITEVLFNENAYRFNFLSCVVNDISFNHSIVIVIT